jgi:hypothetical protein
MIRGVAALITLLTAAWAMQPHPSAAQAWGFECPAAGTAVERSNGGRLGFRGQDPRNRLLCVNELGQSRFLGYWSVQENFFRAGAAQLARMSTAAAEGRPAEETVRYFGTDRFGLSNTIVETWRIGVLEPVRVPAGEFVAMPVTRDFQVVGSAYRYDQTVWFDSRTGVPVKARVQHLNHVMAPTLLTWDAVSIGTNLAALGR